MFKTPIVIISKRFTEAASIIVKVGGITLWPFIILNPDSNDVVTINHETIHIKQYEELFIFGFLFLYVFDYFKGLVKYRDSEKAYYSIRFEQEAYDNARDLEYTKTRASMAWKKYKV